MFSNDNSIKLVISNRKLSGNYSIWKLNNTLLSNSGIKDMSQKTRKSFELTENKNTML